MRRVRTPGLAVDLFVSTPYPQLEKRQKGQFCSLLLHLRIY